MMDIQTKYVSQIGQALTSLFDESSEHFSFDLEGVDLTEFFIAYVKAGGLLFNNLTGEEKNGLEFTHLLNQLFVQDLLKNKD